jgi:hypothetical protein
MKSYQNQDKIEFRQIVLTHLQRILELSSHQLRDSTRKIEQANNTALIEQEDTRYAYIQAIENLAYVLVPHFDKKMNEVYEECIEVITLLDIDIIDLFKVEYKRICDEVGKGNLRKDFSILMKMKCAKELFIELNLLLKRNDYLKSAVYGESEKDEIIEEEE